MQVAIVCWPQHLAKRSDDEQKQAQARLYAVEAEHAIELARVMQAEKELEPFLIGPRGSRFSELLEGTDLPCEMLAGEKSLTCLFRLWRWQRKLPRLFILAIGAGSLTLAGKLYNMRKKGAAELDGVFFMLPPQPARRQGKIFSAMAHLFCGSQQVMRTLRQTQKPEAADSSFVVCQPGVGFCGDGLPASHGRHFVFGMEQSMERNSGALLVTRAMSALWQKKNVPPWEVRMFGSGPRYAEVLGEAGDLGVASRLCILADQDLCDVIGACDAWLVPGSAPDELPSTLWAGVAQGLPTIASASALHKERLGSAAGTAVQLVDEHNPQGLASAMIEIMTDAGMREKMRLAALEMKPQISVEAAAKRICAKLSQWVGESRPEHV